MGALALFANVVGSHNVAVGESSLRNNTSGIYNTAIGAIAMNSNIVGNYNTAIGTNALRIANSDHNVALGRDTLINATSGANNTALGTFAGGSITTGSNNISIGFNIANVTTGDSNIHIGGDAAAANESATIRIGTPGTHTNTYLAGRVHGDGLVPAGTILAYGGSTAPSGYFLCNGVEVARTDYPALFSAIGTAYGAPQATTFRVPDLRGRFIRGVDGGTGRDPDAAGRQQINFGGNPGDAVGSYQADDLKNHVHPLNTSVNLNSQSVGVPISNGVTGSSSNYMNASGGAPGNETRPKNVNVNYIIKY